MPKGHVLSARGTPIRTGGVPVVWNTVDIFAEHGLSGDGVVVVVRPDQYVTAVLPLTATPMYHCSRAVPKYWRLFIDDGEHRTSN